METPMDKASRKPGKWQSWHPIRPQASVFTDSPYIGKLVILLSGSADFFATKHQKVYVMD